MADSLRVAIVGYGLAGRVFHGPLVAATPGLELASVVTGSPERAAQARTDHPGAQVLASAYELWSRAAEHDLVVVAAPNTAHVELTLSALAAGLPVVVDKPMAGTAADARRLRDAAAAAGLLLSPFHNRRWDSDTLTARRLVDAGELGDVLRWESRFERFRPAVESDRWKEQPDSAGGVLLDLGTHVADTALHLFGPVDSLYAEVAVRRPGARVDDDAFLALHHAGGVWSHLSVSLVAAPMAPRVTLRGTAGSWSAPELDGQEDALRDGGRPDTPDWGAEPRSRWGRVVDAAGERELEPEPGAWPAYYAGVRDALRSGGQPPVTADDGVAVLDLLEAARESAATGTVVELARHRH